MSPRPQPVFVPGGMGTNLQSSETEVDLTPTLLALAQLYNQFVKGPREEKAAAEGAKSLVPFIGMGQTGGPLASQAGQEYQPVQPGLDLEPMAKSAYGRGVIAKLAEAKMKPLGLDQLAAAYFMQGRTDLSGQVEAQKHGNVALKDVMATQGPSSPFKLMYASMKGQGKSDDEILQGWKNYQQTGGAPSIPKMFEAAQRDLNPNISDSEMWDRFVKYQTTLQQNRYLPFQQGPTPDYVFNRKKGTWEPSQFPTGVTANDIKEKAGNYAWYKTQGAQRLIRRTESIVAPGGAADESIRFAELVDNPKVTTINNLTGRAKVLFSQSQRQLLNLVTNVSAEEQQQIFGAMGGGERFLELAQSLTDPNLSVDTYVNAVKEIKYLIYTRQVANVRGTPEEKKWADMGAKFKKERPFAPESSTPAGDMDQFWRQ